MQKNIVTNQGNDRVEDQRVGCEHAEQKTNEDGQRHDSFTRNRSVVGAAEYFRQRMQASGTRVYPCLVQVGTLTQLAGYTGLSRAVQEMYGGNFVYSQNISLNVGG